MTGHQPTSVQWDYDMTKDTYTMTAQYQIASNSLQSSGPYDTFTISPTSYAVPTGGPTGANWYNSSSSTSTVASWQQAANQFDQMAKAAKIAANKVQNALPDPPKPKVTDRIKDAFGKLAKGGPMKDVKMPSDKDLAAFEKKFGFPMPVVGGASPDAEVEKTVEREDPKPGRLKIKLRRSVGIVRDKGGPKPEETHAGTVTLVRQTDGADHLTENIGIRVEPSGSTNHVEIPIKMLEEAIEELKKG